MRRSNVETILVVDSEPDILKLLERTPPGEGFEFFTAGTVESAYLFVGERIREFGFFGLYAVVADWGVSEGGGIELLRLIRSGPHRKLPFVLTTGEVSSGELARATELDIDAVLLKPFTIEKLVKKIQQARKARDRKDLVPILG